MRIDELEGTPTMEGTDGESLGPWEPLYSGHCGGVFSTFHAGAVRSPSGAGASWTSLGEWPEVLFAFLGTSHLRLAQGDQGANTLEAWQLRALEGLLFEEDLEPLEDEPGSDPEQMRVRAGRGVVALQSAGRTVVLDFASDIAWRTLSTDVGEGTISFRGLMEDGPWTDGGYDELSIAEFGGLDICEVGDGQFLIIAGDSTICLVGRAQDEAHFDWADAVTVDLSSLHGSPFSITDVAARPDGLIAATAVASGGEILFLCSSSGSSWRSSTFDDASSWSLVVVSEALECDYPRVTWGADGGIWVVAGDAMAWVGDPVDDPTTFSLRCSTGRSDVEVHAGGEALLPFGPIRDAAADESYLYVLQDVLPPYPGGSVLSVVDKSGTMSLWRRTYSHRAFSVTRTPGRYPAAPPVYPGRSTSPPLGEGPDGAVQ